jgi:cation-transporting P-type ATPase I
MAWIEVRGADRPERMAALEGRLSDHPGVAWARMIPVAGRVAVQLADAKAGEDAEEDAEVATDALVAVVEEFERERGLEVVATADVPPRPGDRDAWLRDVSGIVADGLGLGLAVTGRLARLVRLPVEAAGVVGWARTQPWVRRRLHERAGPLPAEVGLAVVSAAVAGLTQGPFGLLLDAGQRALGLRGTAAGDRAWTERAPELMAGVEDDERDHPPPTGTGAAPLTGPAEAYAQGALPAALAAGAGTLLTTGDPRRASALMLAGAPKAARAGVEAFASSLERLLAEHGIVCLDARALRNLDAIDTLVVEAGIMRDEDSLEAGARELVDAAQDAELMVVLAGGSGPEAAEVGADLVMEGGDRLEETLRTLQDDGCGVLLVARSPSPALRRADCAVGLLDEGRPAWGAHVIATDRGLADAIWLVDATAAARQVSRQSAALALGGTGVGALAGAAASQPSPQRAWGATNVASLAAIANAVRAASALAGQRVVLHDEGPPWHALEADEVLERLGSGPDGLGAGEAERRLAELPERGDERLSLGRAFVDELANPLTPALAVGASLSAAVGTPSDAGLVGGVLALSALVGAAQRVRVDRAVGELEEATTVTDARVRRDGDVRAVPAAEVVPGDVVVLASGDAVPADCRLLSADNLEVDESSLTGESLPVAKSPDPMNASAAVADRTSMLYQGTAVAAGEAEAVVVAAGRDTEAGRAAAGEAVISRGVEERLQELSRVTLPVAVAGGLVMVGAGLLRRQSLREAVAPGVSLAVAAVPEGLPLLATVAQLSAARRLAGRGAMARNPQAIETLGRVDVLCVDKTGTLTGGAIELGLVTDGVETWSRDELGPAGERIVAAGVRASPEVRDGEDVPHVTDRAVLNGAAEVEVAADEELDSWSRETELPFEPGRSYHAVLGRTGEAGRLSVKGAPEVILPRCDEWEHPDGPRPIDDEDRRRLTDAYEDLAGRGHRVLAVAEREASDRRDLDDDRVERLRLLGFLGLVDPVRPTAREAVAQLRQAGLRVVMVTGDHPSTAEGIAGELDLSEGGRVLTGAELDDMSDDKLDGEIDGVSVFARVTPSHKVRIVEAYRRRGHAVAMTGDGANDAPAIRLADVGVALGENATAAARAAADLVVPDGRIETIVAAIVEGRALWGSVRDALAIMLGGNLGEIGFTVAGTVVGGRPPLSPRQIMLVNLMTDVAPGLAIAVRTPPDLSPEELLREGPDASLGASLRRAIMVRAVATTAGAGLAWSGARLTGRRERRASTVALAGLVGSQLGQTLASGGRDPVVALAALGSAAALFAIVQTPGISQFFGCTPLGPLGWGIATGSSLAATTASAAAGRFLPA